MSTEKEGYSVNLKVKYRLEINYYFMDYNHKALETSEPIYSLEEGLEKYDKATQEYCIDFPEEPARCWLWKYSYRKDKHGREYLVRQTVRKNYENVA